MHERPGAASRSPGGAFGLGQGPGPDRQRLRDTATHGQRRRGRRSCLDVDPARYGNFLIRSRVRPAGTDFSAASLCRRCRPLVSLSFPDIVMHVTGRATAVCTGEDASNFNIIQSKAAVSVRAGRRAVVDGRRRLVPAGRSRRAEQRGRRWVRNSVVVETATRASCASPSPWSFQGLGPTYSSRALRWMQEELCGCVDHRPLGPTRLLQFSAPRRRDVRSWRMPSRRRAVRRRSPRSSSTTKATSSPLDWRPI